MDKFGRAIGDAREPEGGQTIPCPGDTAGLRHLVR